MICHKQKTLQTLLTLLTLFDSNKKKKMFKYSLSVPSTYSFASSFNKPQKKSTYVYHSNKIRGNIAIEQMLLQLTAQGSSVARPQVTNKIK